MVCLASDLLEQTVPVGYAQQLGQLNLRDKALQHCIQHNGYQQRPHSHLYREDSMDSPCPVQLW